MNSFISSFLEKHKCALRKNLEVPDGICKLRTFTYENTSTPDYTSDTHKNLYFLRYASAYIIEYYLAYKHIFENEKVDPIPNITVLSVGCGSMLDLVSFEYARRNSKKYSKLTPFYYGVDLVDWKCHETKVIENVVFLNCGIEEVNPCDVIAHPIDILFFPKSISEIPQNCLDDFVAKIEEKYLWKQLCVVNSRRGSSSSDSNKAQKFCSDIAEKCGYSIERHLPVGSKEDEEDVYLENLCPGGYKFDRDIGFWLGSLVKESCAFAECGDEKKNECSRIIDIWPTLKAKNISPEIYYLERI